MKIVVTSLPSKYWHARGDGPCNWAQWPMGEALRDEHFFPEAGKRFRVELREFLKGWGFRE